MILIVVEDTVFNIDTVAFATWLLCCVLGYIFSMNGAVTLCLNV